MYQKTFGCTAFGRVRYSWCDEYSRCLEHENYGGRVFTARIYLVNIFKHCEHSENKCARGDVQWS